MSVGGKNEASVCNEAMDPDITGETDPDMPDPDITDPDMPDPRMVNPEVCTDRKLFNESVNDCSKGSVGKVL